MNSISDPRRRRLLAGALFLPWLGLEVMSAQAAPARGSRVRRFDAQTWAQLLRSGPRPAAYVFTTTYCPTCPAMFELLHEHTRKRRPPVVLAAIVMDAQGERALSHAHHYTGATHFYAFDGFEAEIRHAVDAKWRNITPYVVLLDAQGAEQRIIGPPSAAQLTAWLS